jgi:outer membrane protein TolC
MKIPIQFKKRVITAGLICLCIPKLYAQQDDIITLSLKECVLRAVEMNVNVSQAELAWEKSAHKTAEIFASLLPQVDVGSTFQDNIKLPVTMIPGEIFGQPGTTLPVSMGAKFTTSANISANMVLYNQTVLTALKLSKKGEYAAMLGVEKAGEEITKEVAKLYFLINTDFHIQNRTLIFTTQP